MINTCNHVACRSICDDCLAKERDEAMPRCWICRVELKDGETVIMEQGAPMHPNCHPF